MSSTGTVNLVNKTRGSERVIVIGGGIIGLCTSYALLKHGYQVTVIEADDKAGNASSASAGIIGGSAVIPWASHGIWARIPAMCVNRNSPLTLSFPVPRNLLSFFISSRRAGTPQIYKSSAAGLATLGLSGYDNWMELLNELPVAKELFRQTGCYFVYITHRDRESDRQNNVLRRKYGMQLQSIDSEQLVKCIPSLVSTQSGSLKVLKAGYVVDPCVLQQLLRIAIQEDGGRFVTSSVMDFESEGSCLERVCTTDKSYELDHVVIAAGSGSTRLASKIGSDFPMISANGFSLELVGANLVLDAPMLFLKQGIAVTPSTNGIRVAGLVSIGALTARSRERGYAHLLEEVNLLFPGLQYRSIMQRTGARPLMSDSLPVIGRSPYFENAWFNFGHGHWGMTQAASSAKRFVTLFDNDQPSEENPFDPRRFS